VDDLDPVAVVGERPAHGRGETGIVIDDEDPGRATSGIVHSDASSQPRMKGR
jgi:hypothetical protein